MPCICYVPKNFREDKLELIDKINDVVDSYTRIYNLYGLYADK